MLPLGLPRVLGLAVGAGALLAAVALVPACSGDDDGANPPPADVPEAGTPPAPGDAGPPPSPDAGPPPGFDPTSTSGTRLRRRYFEPETGPGAVQTIDLFDKDLGVGCTFEKASDGELRCLPDRLGDVYYADATCSTQPFIVGDSLCSQTFGKTANRPTFFKRTATPMVLDPGAQKYAPSAGGGCVASAVTEEERTYAYAVEEAPVTTFAHGKLVDEPRSGGIVARFAEGDDGSRILLEARDQARNSVCDLTTEPGRCMPTHRATISLFSDASCTDPVAAWGSNLPAPDVLVGWTTGSDGCPGSNQYYAPGGAISAATFYRLDEGGACVSIPAVPVNTYYARGTAYANLDAFPEAKVRLEGTGAIQARRYLDRDGNPIGQAFAFWDTVKNHQCFAGYYSGNSYRCFASHSAQYTPGLSSDASCSTPVGHASCEPNPSDEIHQITGKDCSTNTSWLKGWRRGAPFTGQLYFGIGMTTCGPRAASPGSQYYALGVEISASLPFLDLKTE